MESKSTQHSAQAIVFLLEANIHGQVANRHIRIRDVICLKYVCKIHLDAVSAQRALTRVTLPWPGGHAGRTGAHRPAFAKPSPHFSLVHFPPGWINTFPKTTAGVSGSQQKLLLPALLELSLLP